MVAGDQHRIIVIGPFELRLQPRIILNHQQNMLLGPPTHRQLASFITASALRAPASACGSRKAKQISLPASLATSIVPPIACASCSAQKQPSPKPDALGETKGLNSSRGPNSRAKLARETFRDRGC